MPVFPAVRRLRGDWQRIIRQVTDRASSIPPEGIPLSVFEADCLESVFLLDRPEIVRALASKKLIFPVRDGVEVRVFGAKPESRRFAKPRESETDRFLSVVAPHMLRLSETIAERESVTTAEARSRELRAVAQISTLMRRHVERGANLASLRAGMWKTFREDVMKALASREPMMARDAIVSEIQSAKPKPKRIVSGLDRHERIVAIVRKAGTRGATKTDVCRAFNPKPSMREVDTMLGELIEAEMIQGAEMRLQRRGKPAMRYFLPSVPMPTLGTDLVAWFED
ncbi:hypothetical protein [Methylobacterium sp. WCS2018Hpa-22]|uniref:hypothetical protein n=1 Tax=Methylobacterium sp. WCS2018Hpa-22 TaxID=3073633 RepID=UPI00288C5221|nr:hypothetical protein [Methylobacterium sp. WCS2018Hpa-22]